MNRGKLIVIDGIDGSGKATQTKIIVDWLKTKGLAVATIDFPQYTQNFFGAMVRRYLNGEFGDPTKVNPYLASILYAADRFESADKIAAWLAEGKIVVLDRYHTSNFIHQGTKFSESELDQYLAWDEQMEFEVFKIPRPDLIIYLQLPAQVAYNLIAKRGDGYDGHDTMEHLKLAEQRCQYLAAKLDWQMIECAKTFDILPPDQISAIIKEKISPLIDNQLKS
ncbi:MAG: dTMP kinase [Patescibacteria group bacterium]|jgi:dTMP kinase|nr:dTMP kinase [Patescibacteria group bacterium]